MSVEIVPEKIVQADNVPEGIDSVNEFDEAPESDLDVDRCPPAPEHLSPEAMERWRLIAGEWELDAASLMILESALEAFMLMREAQKIIKVDGILINDRYRKYVKNPAIDVERDAKNTFLRHLKSLNLDIEPLNKTPGRPPDQQRLFDV